MSSPYDPYCLEFRMSTPPEDDRCLGWDAAILASNNKELLIRNSDKTLQTRESKCVRK